MSGRAGSAAPGPSLRRHEADGDRTWRPSGPRSIFAKGLRDCRRAIILASAGLGATVLAIGASTAANYPTLASRQQIGRASCRERVSIDV